jgi:hypothetical protein
MMQSHAAHTAHASAAAAEGGHGDSKGQRDSEKEEPFHDENLS